ncbi:MAG: site-specific DNA-methyltransferase [Sulfurimonas sp.]
MTNFKEQFKEFILNDIFWFNKSELNFGIYKIFRQKEKFIKEKLDLIVANIEASLSSSKESELDELKKELRDNFVPPKLELETFGQVKAAIEKYCNGEAEKYLQKLQVSKSEDRYDSTKVYEYLYQFFNLYYEKGDFGYTPRSFRTYSIPYAHEEYLSDGQNKTSCESSHEIDYRGEETLFTWKTKDSYYIKSNKFLNSVTLNLTYEDTDYKVHTNIIEKDEDIKDDKKVKQYRLVSIKKDGKSITLNFNISDHATPKHTIYLLMLSVIKEDIKEFNYDDIFSDKKLKEYFEQLPFKDTKTQTSLLDANQSKVQSVFKELIEDEMFKKYLFDKDKNIFKSELSGEEDKTQLRSKTSKLKVSKKEYLGKVYTKTRAREFLGLNKKEKFELEDKNDYEKLYEKDDLLNFFYRLDRGINLFYAGVDSDYFIHKNLKRFLSVELDKFIKNYIFADTDAILLMDDNAQKIANFARVFKIQANIFIELLSSIEEFQKYLWEKRKMVKSSNYVISSNKIENTAILETVLQNRDQIDEWENLGIIKPNAKPNIIELQSYSYPIDTKHFSSTFKYQVLSQFENIEEETSGLLIKSENYQALKFLEPKYTDKKGDGKIKCVYIDPPYNTGNDGFVYKDSFKSASWLSMMNDRLEVARKLMREDSTFFISIDANEISNTYKICDDNFGRDNRKNTISIKRSSVSGAKVINPGVVNVAEQLVLYAKSLDNWDIYKTYREKDRDTRYNNFIKNIEDDPSKWEFITVLEAFAIKSKVAKNQLKKHYGENYENKLLEFILNHSDSIIQFASLDDKNVGQDAVTAKHESIKHKDTVIHYERGSYEDYYFYNGKVILFVKNKIVDIDGEKVFGELITDMWDDVLPNDLHNEGGVTLKKGKKPEKMISRVLNFATNESDIVLDYFVGSGTTAAVSHKLGRKYLAIEMNDYFDNITLKRIKNVIYGEQSGISKSLNFKGGGIVQYIELEQYDDIIDNLTVEDVAIPDALDLSYIYEPDKNQINFRMDKELANPLDEDNKFDIFSSLLFHEGLELLSLSLDDEVLVATTKDIYAKECGVILGADKKSVQEQIKQMQEKYTKIYTNINVANTEQILAETFKGK